MTYTTLTSGTNGSDFDVKMNKDIELKKEMNEIKISDKLVFILAKGD